MTLLSLVVAAYVAESCLRALPAWHIRQAARRFGIPYESRSKLEMVRDLRRQGVDAYPAVFPAWQGLRSGNAGLLPLGGIAGVTTVFCNEMGQFIVYESDEHGFNNPKGIWSSSAFEVVALGDSFTQGACVPSEENFTGLIRRQFPATLNLGMLGNGPLLMLAGLREFLVDLRPKVVLWVYTEGNDLIEDVALEKRSRILMSYLTPGYRQGLLRRQAEVDDLMRGIADREYVTRLAGDSWAEFPPRFWRLWALRQAVGLQVGEKQFDPATIDVRLFREVLEQARETVRGWGGEIYFVYNPARGGYYDDGLRRQLAWARGQVLQIVQDLGLPLIDLDARMSRHPDLASLYSYPGGHFSPAGNRLVADTIQEALRAGATH
jgi:lysophospholipase L1-like esterase